MITLKKTKIEDIHDMIEKSCKELIAPRDDYWEEAALAKCVYHLIVESAEIIGYFAIGKDNALYQFYLSESHRLESQKVFKFILDELMISELIVETYDINYFILALDLAKDIRVHSYMYKQSIMVQLESPITNMNIHLTTIDNLPDLVEEAHVSLGGTDKGWLTGYYQHWIDNDGIYIFTDGNKIAAIGEIRTGFRSKDVAYLGIVVTNDYRKKGLGKYVTGYLRKKANEFGYTAIASVNAKNIGSNKMMVSSGFFAYHRLLKITL